jgi:Zn-dependent peptidase ImmA (M78 family)
MLVLPPRPVLDWKTIAEKARSFVQKHRISERPYPLDVEEIAEFDLEMEIRVTAGLLEDFDSPAQIAPGDLHPIITVDADQYRQQTSFYRYSVAHEIGHYVLHREWLEKVWRMVDSTSSWKQAVLSRSEDDYKWIEGQAEEFASYLLAPETVFEPFLNKQITPLQRFNLKLHSEDILPYLANPVAEFFGMSNTAAQARIRKSPQWHRLVNSLNGADLN